MYLHLKRILTIILFIGLNFTMTYAQFTTNGTTTAADNNFTSRISRSGSIGIGVTYPSTKLHVKGFDNTGTTATLKITSGSQNMLLDGNEIDALDETLHFNYNSRRNTTICANGGNVGVGTGDPNTRLHVKGFDNTGTTATLKITSGSQNMLLDGNEIDALNTELHLNFNSRRNTTICANGGNVAIGKYTPQYRLDVNGTAVATGGFWTASDKRFKKNIKDLETPNEKINQLNGVTYKFKKEKFGEIDFTETDDRTEYGFLAQDLKKVFPELVREDEDGYFVVRYEGLIPVLVEAVKDQNAMIGEQAKDLAEQATTIEEQAEEIENLNARMNELESMIKSLATTSQVGNKTDNTIIQNTAILKQNTPNPFNNNTTIQYELPSNVRNASLVIYDITGKSLQSFSISGKGSVEFDASGLENGTYIYSILSNGESIARQKMVVQK